ncbi:insulinase family protein [Clostridium sp. MCC353]|uniref:insulinase family protein n=1 Tax=Clostridium sp. MCC353 TaxID=2592646 RepID=UPI001C021B5F|nr:insulinase family protein [Clostridium sp. MCC353]MBT9775575.1 insulinase family protein [Clostridium sp. MCC353]
MSKLEELTTYRLLEKRRLEEINSTGMILEHIKSGARLFLISNEDENKVFNIGFRTPPSDSTGVPHILEHSVLCGSAKFSVKDPFVELVKGSLNTFLNAMTYPDKTVYPVASCNDKDFQNLMDVYMDAVLHPNIYKEEKIFMQEGWHYELEEADQPLIYNGVVYNEMKGAFSSPESVLDRFTRKVLFPDTCYGFESGGDPSEIPNLTYEEFLNFHRKYYHPSNSYIYLYGDMDMAEKLEWLDREYLSHYDKAEIDSEIRMQKPFEKPVEETIYYSITDEESEEGATYLSVSDVVGTDLDPKLYIAFQILEYTLIDAPGAPLKQALLDAGIGQDILGGYDSGILQPYFSVVAKNAEKEQKGEFLAVLKGTLRKLADQGIDRKILKAGLNYYEFRYREADYGSAPSGLMYGLQCLDSWLYDGDPMMHLEYEDTFEYLKKAVDEGYFENLIREYLLDNPFEAVIAVCPKKNLTAEEEIKLSEKMAAYKASLSKEEMERLVKQTKELKLYQETPSTQEELSVIPLLSREDIGREPEKLIWEEKEVDGVKVIHHEMFTSEIGYLRILFNTNRVPVEDLPYVGLLKSVLGYVDTEHYNYTDLSSEIYLNSGGISFSVTSYPNLREPENFFGVFQASAKVMYDKLEFGFDMIREILLNSKLGDEKRLGEILGECKSRSKMKLEGSFHSAAVARATSYFSPVSSFNDITGGVGYYEFLERTVKEYESNKKGLIKKLEEVAQKLFTSDNMLISYTADENGYSYLPKALRSLKNSLPMGNGAIYPYKFEAGNKNEGFTTASQVNYVARCGSFRDKFAYTGALRILKVILSYDYLWINLRVKGGAYGCMSGFGRSGEGYLVSYRDPNLKETDVIYEGIPEYLEHFDIDERDMTKYVIGTISDLDIPYPPSSKGSRGLSAYLSGVTPEMMKEERMQILDATQEDIRKLAGLVKAVLDTKSLCVIGNKDKIEAERPLFKEVKNLYHS